MLQVYRQSINNILFWTFAGFKTISQGLVVVEFMRCSIIRLKWLISRGKPWRMPWYCFTVARFVSVPINN